MFFSAGMLLKAKMARFAAIGPRIFGFLPRKTYTAVSYE